MIHHSGQSSPVLQSVAPAAAGRRRSDSDHTRVDRQPAAATVAPQTNDIPPARTDAQETAADLQDQWTEAICRNMEIPEGYARVAVLIVKWAKHLDDLKCESEVNQLDDLFRDGFHYETDKVDLDGESPPQRQLIFAISSFLNKFDGPNNLLIIYYTGHSGYNTNSGELEFYARNSSPEPRSKMPKIAQCASWNFAETLLLRDTQADTLAILDTCYASNVTKGGVYSGRAYQLLAASGPDRLTAGPGPKSFTTAMIQVLQEWLKENVHSRMNLWKLTTRINEKHYRRQNPCFFQDRLKQHDRQIYLAPLKKDKDAREKNEKVLTDRTSVADLTLRFALGSRSLKDEQIEELTKQLPQACKIAGVKLQRIDWVNFEERPVSFKNTVLAFRYAHLWLRKALPKRKKRRQTVQEPVGISSTDVTQFQTSPQPDGITISTEAVNIGRTGDVHMHNETAIVNTHRPSIVHKAPHLHDHRRRRSSVSDDVRTPSHGDRVVSVNIGNMGPLTAAVISMGVLSCITTILCTRSALRT